MLSCTHNLRTECSVFITFNNMVLIAPDTCLVEVIRLLDITELACRRIRFRFTLKSPNERYHLGTGTHVGRFKFRLFIVTFNNTLIGQIVGRVIPEILGVGYVFIKDLQSTGCALTSKGGSDSNRSCLLGNDITVTVNCCDLLIRRSPNNIFASATCDIDI